MIPSTRLEATEMPERQQPQYQLGKVIYENALASERDIAGFRLEGQAKISFANGRMRMEPAAEAGPTAHCVNWCPQEFPDNVAVSWDFWPVKEPGLAILFFSAIGRNGLDLFDPKLAKRSGVFDQYIRGDIDTLHVSYFRRNLPKTEKQLWVCNLRKNHGFHMVAQGPDPIPSVAQATPPYRIQVVKMGPQVWFSIEDILSFKWIDDGKSFGDVLGGGRIGFRQMTPLVAEYGNLKVCQAVAV